MDTNFINVYENSFSKEFCENAITSFEALHQAGNTFSRGDYHIDNSSELKDTAAFHNQTMDVSSLHQIVNNEFYDMFWKIINNYTDQYSESLVHQTEPLSAFNIKIQKTNVSEGYHIWHYESPTRSVCQRVLAFITYLNTVDEGGETEFLYQHTRVKPVQGTTVVFPAGFTHLHRGNPPLSGTKYIITGWLEL